MLSLTLRPAAVLGRRVLLGVLLTATATSCVETPAAQPVDEQQSVQPSTTQPTPGSTSTSTTSTSTSTTTTVPDSFINDCVDHTMFLAYVGDARGQAKWDGFEQDLGRLEQDCERIALRDSNERASLQSEMNQLATFLSTPAPSTTDTPVVTAAVPRPTTTIRQAPPDVAIQCAQPGTGAYEWYRVDFGYSFASTAPIVEWGMSYGDGKSYSAYEETAARNDVYWHKYYSPGSYKATAWVVDANGLRDEASCTWNWTAPPRPVAVQPVLPNSACDPNYTGCVPIASDVDCAGGSGNGPAYTGTVQVIGRDIYDLDRDGDGWACE